MKNKNIGPRKVTRSLLDSDSTAPKKKKLKTGSNELVVVTSALPDKPRSTKRALKAQFGERSDTILEMIEGGDEDGGLTLLKRALLKSVVNVLPMAEQAIINSETGKGTYQFVTLISQIRELIADIQADQDRKYIAQRILETIIRPMFMDIAQAIITDHHEFRKSMESMVMPKHTASFNQELQTLAKGLAAKMNTQYKETEIKISDALKN